MVAMAASFKRVYASTVVFSAPGPQQATVNLRLHQRLLDTHRQVRFSLLRSHCSFLLGPGVHKGLFVPSKSLFPQSCGSSAVKSHWPSKSNSLGVLSSFVGSQLGKSVWDLELLQQYENFFRIIVPQFVGCLLGCSVVGFTYYTSQVSTEKDAQLESCKLSFIWGKMRTAAQEAASQIASTVGEGQYIRFWWGGGGSIPLSTHFTKGFY